MNARRDRRLADLPPLALELRERSETLRARSPSPPRRRVWRSASSCAGATRFAGVMGMLRAQHRLVLRPGELCRRLERGMEEKDIPAAVGHGEPPIASRTATSWSSKRAPDCGVSRVSASMLRPNMRGTAPAGRPAGGAARLQLALGHDTPFTVAGPRFRRAPSVGLDTPRGELMRSPQKIWAIVYALYEIEHLGWRSRRTRTRDPRCDRPLPSLKKKRFYRFPIETLNLRIGSGIFGETERWIESLDECVRTYSL